MFRRAFTATTIVTAIFVLTAHPAWAHEEINPKILTTGQPTFLTLSAANEKKADLVKVVLSAPKGVPLGGTTSEPAGWQVTKTDATITWTAPAGGGIPPDHFAHWGFETDGADQPGSFPYQLDLAFADGSHDPVTVPVTVTAPNGPDPVRAEGSKGRTSGTTADLALVVGVIGIVLALVALGAVRRTKTRRPETQAAPDW